MEKRDWARYLVLGLVCAVLLGYAAPSVAKIDQGAANNPANQESVAETFEAQPDAETGSAGSAKVESTKKAPKKLSDSSSTVSSMSVASSGGGQLDGGSGISTPSVDVTKSTGAAIASIPIAVPPGRAGRRRD